MRASRNPLPADTHDTVRCTPVPHWVAHRPYALQPEAAEDACIANGVCRLLCDIQVDLCSPESAWHLRIAQRVLTRAGAERAAHFVTDFDPSYERLEVHFVRILRGEEIIEHARPGAIQTFQREAQLERLVLDGRLTASLLVPDVRAGDIVEFSITWYGSKPALGGKWSAWMIFDSFNPWLEKRYRLVRPVEREIFIKSFNDPPAREVTEHDGIEESQWRIVGQQRREAEELTPPWLMLTPNLQFTEFRSWNEVACLFAPLYESATVPPTLASEIDRLAAAHPDPADRAAEWLRFVQQNLRYFALALGDGGLSPRELETIWASRLGDCKDAARLYVAGAQRMGLDACAALVSSTHGPALADLLPSPMVFDHCIVRLRLDGVSYWLDPSADRQSGNLQNIFQAHMGWALPLTPQTTGLESLDSETPQEVVNCEDEVQFGPARASPARLRRLIEHFSGSAEVMRRRFAEEGTAEYAKEMLKKLRATWPGVLEAAPLEISDDPVRNRLATVHTYEIPDCWKQGTRKNAVRFDIVDPFLGRELAPLGEAQRRTDIYLGRPRKLTRRVRMEMPRAWSGTGWRQEIETPGLRYRSVLSIEGRTITDTRELLIAAWCVPADQAHVYGTAVSRLNETMLTILARVRFSRIRPAAGLDWRGRLRALWPLVPPLVLLALMLLGHLARQLR